MATSERWRGRFRGRLQGVGFRPFVAGLARACGVGGFVANEGRGVILEVEGDRADLERFVTRLANQGPPQSSIDEADWESIDVRGETAFSIAASVEGEGPRRVSLVPDRRVCAECLAEVRDPANRRFEHPFATCTRCGPRFSMATGVPFDRERTTMSPFAMCEACRAEYASSADRRHHAQTLSCPSCGPSLRLLGGDGRTLARRGAAIDGAVGALERGEIVALQGVGGFLLAVDATDEAAVARLRRRKRRPAKPLAVMVVDLEMARALAHVEVTEAEALEAPSGPIVLVEGRGGGIASSVAPDRTRLGLMLPTASLHTLLAERFGRPIVATSGNRHEDPVAIEVDDALARLGDIADVFLVHDLGIARRCDDSVVHVVDGRVRVIRLGRGFAPTRVPMPAAVAGAPILALGGHLKQAPALAYEEEALLWPHVGDLFELASREAMERSVADLLAITGCDPAVLAVDAHPDYATTQWAEDGGRPIERVWHHHAHVAAVLAEHGVESGLGLAWDGVGLGPDQTAWGGEVLAVDPSGVRRVGHFRPFGLPGGDLAARDGRRALAGLLAAAELDCPDGMPALARWHAIARDARVSPATTSVGRIFDAVAALVGSCSQSRYEGEAAARLEELVPHPVGKAYPFAIDEGMIDWRPMLACMLDERHDAVRVAGRFHATLAAIAVEVVAAVRTPVVVLAGGCFQNRVLCQLILDALREREVRVLLPARVPVSDGGLALGQAWVVAHRRAVG